MASPKCGLGALRHSASTTTRSSRSWGLTRTTSMPCAQAGPYRKQRIGRPEAESQERGATMSDVNTESTGGILRVELNRPARKNALTGSMYTSLAEIFDDADKDESVHVVLWHGVGDSFSAGNDVGDFLKNPPGPGESPQRRLMDAFVSFEKPIVVAVQGAAVGGGTTMLTHCDVVYAGESARVQLPFINLALVPEFGSSSSLPAR